MWGEDLPRALRWLSCLLVGSLLTAYWAGLRINTTASMPRGLYRMAGDVLVQRGELVVFCLRRGELHDLIVRRGYFSRSRQCPGGLVPLLKRVAGVPGDHYRITTAGITLNGRSLAGTAQLPCDGQGLPLPVPAHAGGNLPPDHYLLLGEATGSFDSRYLGPVDKSQIIGRLRPLWVGRPQGSSRMVARASRRRCERAPWLVPASVVEESRP